MKDFLKVFFSIVALVLAFMAGKNYGVHITTESTDYKNFLESRSQPLESTLLKNENESTSALVATAETVKGASDSLSDQSTSLSLLEASSAATAIQTKTVSTTNTAQQNVTEPLKPWSSYDLSKYKSKVWLLQNSKSEKEIFNYLEQTYIKNIKSYLFEAVSLNSTQIEKFIGEYRGSVKSNDNKSYGSIILKINTDQIDVSIISKGQTITNFKTANLEDVKTVSSIDGFILYQDQKVLQVFNNETLKQLVGVVYESLPNGTMKLVGKFILKPIKL